jgi:hypothetical protein
MLMMMILQKPPEKLAIGKPLDFSKSETTFLSRMASNFPVLSQSKEKRNLLICHFL